MITQANIETKPAATDVKPSQQYESQSATKLETNDALNIFLSAPSFSTKQKALEMLLSQITQGSAHWIEKNGTTG